MKRTTEQTLSISIPESARNLREKILEGGRKADNTFNNVITNVEEVKGTKEYIEKYFPIVKASELMLGDEFLKYRPETVEQSNFKRRLIKTIKYGISDFRAQSIDPSFDEKGKICYKAEMKPAIGKSVKWWKQNSEEFLPESIEGFTSKRYKYGKIALTVYRKGE